MKNYIKKHREIMGLSQGDLANTLDVSRQTINSIENGKFDPSLTLAMKLTKFFNEPIDTLFEYKE
jgi:putative transcriptional regulator